MFNDDNDFNLYLSQIIDAFNKNPKDTTDIIKRYCDYVDYKKINKRNIVKVGKYLHILLLVFVCFLILVVGFLKVTDYAMYIGGFVFFVAGMLIGSFVPGFGIIFLFSHGMTGFGLMVYSLSITDYLVLLTDLPEICIIIILLLVLCLFICGICLVILNSFGRFKGNKYGVCYSFICFLILLVILQFIPEIIKFFNWVL